MPADDFHDAPPQPPYAVLEAEALQALTDAMERTGAVHVQSRAGFRDVFRRMFAVRLNPDVREARE